MFLQYFLRNYAERHGIRPPELAPDALAQLVAYDWPGNVRELKNVAERLIVRSHASVVTFADLPVEVQASGSQSRRPQPPWCCSPPSRTSCSTG